MKTFLKLSLLLTGFSLIFIFAATCYASRTITDSAKIQLLNKIDATNSPEDVSKSLYAFLSFANGEKANRNQLQLLFAPDAQIIYTGPRADGSAGEQKFTVESFLDFATSSGKLLTRQEREIWRRVERFGNIAHVFSAYELSFQTDASKKAIKRRGINSIQLSFDGVRWRIVSLIWDIEREGNPLPEDMQQNN